MALKPSSWPKEVPQAAQSQTTIMISKQHGLKQQKLKAPPVEFPGATPILGILVMTSPLWQAGLAEGMNKAGIGGVAGLERNNKLHYCTSIMRLGCGGQAQHQNKSHLLCVSASVHACLCVRFGLAASGYCNHKKLSS